VLPNHFSYWQVLHKFFFFLEICLTHALVM
jgi:hypothetical protein